MIKAIVFDADDTLWSNEPLFRAAERNCFELLSQYGSREWLNDELYKTEMSNMAELGYGAKAFIISMIETAVRVSGGTVSADTILQIEQAGRAIMRNPAEPLPGVTEALTQIKKLDRYGMAVLTKGGIGGGDIKLVAALGLWLGSDMLMTVVIAGIVLGGMAALIMLATGKRKKGDYFAYGPYFTISALLFTLL